MSEQKPNHLEAHSLHIFAYPIKVTCTDGFQDSINSDLVKLKWSRKKAETWDEIRSEYASQKYRNKNARKIFDGETPLCKVYASEKVTQGGYTFNVDCKQKIYKLHIDSMELHMYQEDYAIIFIKALNMDYPELNDIKNINNYGRCMDIPFIPEEKDGEIICPEQIAIVKDEIKYAAIEYREIIKAMHIEQKCIDDRYKNDFVTKLFMNFEPENKQIKVETISDYRSFLISLIKNDALSERLAKDKEGEDKELESEWYAILHADSGSATCTNAKMRKELLDQKSYYRWKEYGTVYGVTEYSFVSLTSSNNCEHYIIDNFYYLYMDMISLVLAQKNGIMNLMIDVENIEENFNKSSGKTSAIQKLQSKYAVWKNQILIAEYTDQEQGIELYNLMQEQMLVFKEKAFLDEKMQMLYEMAVVSNESNMARASLIVSLLSFLISVAAFIVSFI